LVIPPLVVTSITYGITVVNTINASMGYITPELTGFEGDMPAFPQRPHDLESIIAAMAGFGNNMLTRPLR